VKDRGTHGAGKAALRRALQAIRPVFPTQTIGGPRQMAQGKIPGTQVRFKRNDEQKAQSCASGITFDMAAYVSLGMNRPRCLYV
jgi:hypothetical protein